MSGLDFQVVDVKFDQGLDTKTQRKLVLAGKWDILTNLALSEDNTPQRRDGFTTLVTSANGNGLALHGDELLVVNGSTVSSVSTAGTATANAVSGKLGYVGVAKKEVRRSTAMQDSTDCAYGSGLICYVWRELTAGAAANGINCTLVDETTGAQLVANSVLHSNAAAFCPRVVFAGSCFFIFYIRGTSLYCRVIAASAPAVVGAEVALITSASLAALAFDACAFGTNSAMVSYGWADGVTSIRTIQVTQAATVPSIAAGPTNLFTEVQLPIATLSAIATLPYSSGPGQAATFTVSSGGAAMAGLAGTTIDATWAVAIAATSIDPTAPPVGNCHVTAVNIGVLVQTFYDQQMNWGTNAASPIRSSLLNQNLTTNSGPASIINSASYAGGATDPAGPKGPWISGKAFASGSSTYLPVAILENYQGLAATKANNNQQNTFFLLECTGAASAVAPIRPVVVAKALYGALGCAGINNNPPVITTPCSTPSVSTGNFAIAVTERTLLSFVGGFNVSPTGVVRLTLSPNTTKPPIRCQLGESTYFAGGSLASYDGLGLCEHGFPLFPEGINVEVVAGGGAMTAGVHQVVVIAEWVDNAGQRHQSAPSLAVSGTTAAGDRLRVRVPTLQLSQKSGLTFVAYVTQAAGLTFNRVATTAAGSAGTANDTTVAFVTLPLIDAADVTYASNEPLYTQPNLAGVPLANLAPPPCSAIGVHQNRLWFDKADQPGAWGYSQPYTNNLGLQFNEQLGGMLDVSAGSFTGFSELDEKMVLFCSRKIYALFGTGPALSGGFSNYSDPQEIPSDVGCSEPRSILRMPGGIIFKSVKGWYLLGRDLQVRYIGTAVASYDANTVTSAVLMEDRQECRFTLGDSATTWLVYDYLRDQWSTTQMTYNTGAGSFVYSVADAIWWPALGYYAHVSTSRGLNRDTPGVFLDVGSGGSTAITTVARTSWLHVAQLGAFQRVRRLLLTGTSPTAPTSTLTTTVDFDDAYGGVAPGAYNFSTVFSTITFVAGMPIDLRSKLRRQKCKSIAFTFTDVPTITNPAGVNFQALALEVGMKRGLSKLPAAQSVG